MDPLTSVSTRATSQLLRADERQIPNAAGGYGFALDDDTRVLRFLTLGTDGGTYYATARELTAQNAPVVLRAARERTAWLVEQVVAISTAGRAPRQNPAIFALAAAAALGDEAGRRGALDALPAVCRTGTHLFLFARYVEQFRGWGRGLRRAVARWYTEPDVDDVAFQAVKYRQREGWSHRDLLRLAHPAVTDPARRALFRWIVDDEAGEDAPEIVHGYLAGRAATTDLGLGPAGHRPPAVLGDAPGRRARRAGRVAGPARERAAADRPAAPAAPADPSRGADRGHPPVRRRAARRPGASAPGRVHPVSVLVALRTYASGSGAGGTWEPIREIVDALDAAFYAAFDDGRAVREADAARGGRVGVDEGRLGVRAPAVAAGGVGGARAGHDEHRARRHLRRLHLGRRRLGAGARRSSRSARASGSTTRSRRCPACPSAAPTARCRWSGRGRRGGRSTRSSCSPTTRPGRARSTRTRRSCGTGERSGIDARLVVVGMTATDVSIADPADGGMLDVAGFDAAAPGLVADFSRGDLG